MIKNQVIVKNQQGLHLRPAARIVEFVRRYRSRVTFFHEFKQADPRSILELMSLGATKGVEITVVTEGPDEQEAAKGIMGLFSDGAGI